MDPRSNPNIERAIITVGALIIGALGTWLSLDVVAICQAVINGSQ